MTDDLDGKRLYLVSLSRTYEAVVFASTSQTARGIAESSRDDIAFTTLSEGSIMSVLPITHCQQIPEEWETESPYIDEEETREKTCSQLWTMIERRESETMHGQQNLFEDIDAEDPDPTMHALKVFCRKNDVTWTSEHINEGKQFLVTFRRNGSLIKAAIDENFDNAVLKLLEGA